MPKRRLHTRIVDRIVDGGLQALARAASRAGALLRIVAAPALIAGLAGCATAMQRPPAAEEPLAASTQTTIADASPVVPAPAERDITSAAVSTPIGSASTGLASPAVPSPVVAQASDLPDLGPAPAVVSDHWLNVEAPLDWTALDGTVRVVEFWTFGCINCINDIPAVRGWHDAYGNRDDFRIVSVHYPEFAREHDLDAVAASLERLHVPYAVAIDNDGVNWRAWRQRAWPTRYVVDRHGRIRFTHVGEGAYDQTTHAIEALLAER